jgi:hypothetical protein
LHFNNVVSAAEFTRYRKIRQYDNIRFGTKQSWPISKYYLDIRLQRLIKTKKPVRTARFRAEFRTRYLRNNSQTFTIAPNLHGRIGWKDDHEGTDKDAKGGDCCTLQNTVSVSDWSDWENPRAGYSLTRINSDWVSPEYKSVASKVHKFDRYTRVYQKVSGLAAWSENCKWYNSLPLGVVYRYFVSQTSEFWRHNPLCCFSTSFCCCLFRYRLSPETSGHTLVLGYKYW